LGAGTALDCAGPRIGVGQPVFALTQVRLRRETEPERTSCPFRSILYGLLRLLVAEALDGVELSRAGGRDGPKNYSDQGRHDNGDDGG
jgi:hypothetical protein